MITTILNSMKVLYDLKRNIMIFTISLSQIYERKHHNLLKSKRNQISLKRRNHNN